MALIDNLIAWCKEERQQMQKQLEWLEAGKAQFRTMTPGIGWVDTTADDIKHYKQKIAELDVLIARHPDVE